MEAGVKLLTERVQRLEDLEEIRTTWRDYCIRLDCWDLPKLGDVFKENAILEMDGLSPELDGTYRGRIGIINDFYARAQMRSSGNPNLFATGHLSTNMQVDLKDGEATTVAYFFEIVSNNDLLIGTYQHRLVRDLDRWRFAFLRIAIRYRARIQASDVTGQTLRDILARPLQ